MLTTIGVGAAAGGCGILEEWENDEGRYNDILS